MDVALDEFLLRGLAAFTMSLAFWYVAFSLWRGDLAPKVVWYYLLMVLGLKAAFRWVVFVGFLNLLPRYWQDALDQWQVPINQALYSLMGVAICLLTYSHVVGRKRHAKFYHE